MTCTYNGQASLCYRNRLDITALMCEQKPYPVWFFVPTQELSGIMLTLNGLCRLAILFFNHGTYVIGVPFVYVDYILESCWSKTHNSEVSQLVGNI